MAADRGERGGERVGMRTIHEPRCNTACLPDKHYLSDGIGMPHIHRTDLSQQCGECAPAHPQEPTDLALKDGGERGGAGE